MSGVDSIKSLLKSRKVIITCGTGGVGKTTLSAALGVHAFHQGKRVVVITIDPAKRLATSLGLKTLGDEATDLSDRLREASTGQMIVPGGSFSAIIPDTRQTFVRFVRELSPDDKTTERILKNPIFEIFAREFSGANEYMALERLFELVRDPKVDCIILDTPPSRNTLDFLDAPKLLARFFEEKLIRLLVSPSDSILSHIPGAKLGNRLIAGGARKILSVLESLTGSGFLTHLLDFATDLFRVQDNFVRNLRQITELLSSSQVGFVMVTTPMPGTLDEAKNFIRNVESHGFTFDGVAINRSLSYLKMDSSGGATSTWLKGGLEIVRGVQEREKRVLDGLNLSHIPVIAAVPELKRDVHCIEDLVHVAKNFSAKQN